VSDRRYGTQRWKRLRAQQLRLQPLCEEHLRDGYTVAATVADHVIPHRGDDELFWNGQLQSLCASCHSREKQREEVRGYTDRLDDDGWPVDPRNPANGGPTRGVKSSGALASRPAACPACTKSRIAEEGPSATATGSGER
jgi:5-methylcytosine-specific restriction enzyme A